MAKPRPQGWFRRNWKWLVSLYLVLLGGSHVVTGLNRSNWEELEPPRQIIEVEGKRLAYLEWGAQFGGTPIILVHGTPSRGAADFETLGEALARQGRRRVIALDRWGWGSSERWVPDYSFLSDANAVVGLMDQLGIPKAHLVGMSYGGGPVLLLAERDPKRVQSVTLIAAMGAMKGEGSGHYLVEQAKYLAGYPLVMAAGELIPHFGLLGSRADRHSLMQDFRDCDQRTMEGHLRDMRAPLLLVHGKNDPLVAAWVAWYHHEVQPASRLVLLDASHFFAFGGEGDDSFETTTEEITAFARAADTGTTPKQNGFRNETDWRDVHGLWGAGPKWRGYKPLWMVAAVSLVVGLFLPRTGAGLAGLGGGLLLFDFLTALVVEILAGLVKRREGIRRGKLVLVQIGIAIPCALVGGFVMMVI